MVQTVTKLEYLTKDGRKFDTLQKAEAHERAGFLVSFLEDWRQTREPQTGQGEYVITLAMDLLTAFDIQPKASYRGPVVREL